MPAKPAKPTLPVDASPIQRFQASANNLKTHQDMVDSDAFEKSSDAALLDILIEIGRGVTDPNSAMRAGYEASGAVKAMRRLKTLAEIDKAEPAAPMVGLLQPTEPTRRP
jgi:hypothetical protein